MSSFVDSEGVPISKSASPITIVLDEESVLSRLDVVKGFCSAEQEQHLCLVTKNPLSLNLHKRLHYHGTNRGSTLAIVALPSWNDEEVWRERVLVKKSIIGKAAKIAVGGPAAGDPGNEKRDKVRTDRWPRQMADGRTEGRTGGRMDG